MTPTLSRSLFAAVAASFFTLACACNSASKPGGGAAAEAPDTVVATYGTGQKITLKQIDDTIGDELADIEKKKFQARKQAIEKMILETLVKAEAAKKNMKEEEWIKAEIESKIPD